MAKQAKAKSKHEASPPEGLREALLRSALELVEREGVGALSLREVARRLGVTHQAPYHYFRDRGALLGALAAEGFARLTRALAESSREGAPLERLRAAGAAYVRFAREERGYFALMFRPELLPEPVTVPEGPAAFGVLLELVRLCQDAGHLEPGDPHPWALLCWSTVHGIAALHSEGPLAALPGVPALAEERVNDLLVGLFARPLARKEKASESKRRGR